ncbi:MAG: BREX-1 system phosphatase PglZ type B, partial [Candidatus Competibacteraceae bacterium]|nr:BREX-1 system phosphatase PglZ type B [Candidatus Competibacteraceae bacterium]
MTPTVLDRLLTALDAAARFNDSLQVPPAAVLWTDRDRQWEAIIPTLQARRPQLLVLGDYAPEHRRGPAIWLKCMIARTLPEADWPQDTVPLLYLPGVARLDLRALESCPRELQPLAELQYRGAFWAQVNGKDWSVRAFLGGSRGGLKLDVAQDQATQVAMLRALPALLDTPVADLEGRRLEAGDFDELITGDPVRDLLTWLNDPQGIQDGWDPARWEVFTGRCRHRWNLDPLADGPLSFAEALAHQEPALEPVWERYRETWRVYPEVAPLLERATPRDMLTPGERFPTVNAREEGELRRALAGLEGKAQAAACGEIIALEARHGERRDWLWQEMGQAPLARALAPLAELAALVTEPFGGNDVATMAEAYRERFWQVDALALEALIQAPSGADQTALECALKAVYVPWLDRSAHRFQTLVRQQGGLVRVQTIRESRPADYQASAVCWVFVVGLRWDVARMLCRRLEAQGLSPRLESRWSTVPSVTASGKIACSPLAGSADDGPPNDRFIPRLRDADRELDTGRLRKGLEQ